MSTPSSLTATITDHVDAFARTLADALFTQIRARVAQQVAALLGDPTALSAPVSVASAPVSIASSLPSGRITRRTRQVLASGRTPGAKRPRAEITALRVRVLDWIRTHPDCSAEELNAGLGTTTADVSLPLAQLFRERVITRHGQARGTRYRVREVPATPKAKAKAASKTQPRAKAKAASKKKPEKPKAEKKPAASKAEKKPEKPKAEKPQPTKETEVVTKAAA